MMQVHWFKQVGEAQPNEEVKKRKKLWETLRKLKKKLPISLVSLYFALICPQAQTYIISSEKNKFGCKIQEKTILSPLRFFIKILLQIRINVFESSTAACCMYVFVCHKKSWTQSLFNESRFLLHLNFLALTVHFLSSNAFCSSTNISFNSIEFNLMPLNWIIGRQKQNNRINWLRSS